MMSKLNRNYSEVTEFILLGFRTSPEVQILLFFLFLLIYVVIVLRNHSMLVVIEIDSRLHTPMYFFLKNLSYLDLSATPQSLLPKLTTVLSKEKKISHNDCATQFFFFALFVGTEDFFLTVMAYDRFSAICSPFLYTVCMSQQACLCLVVGSSICGFINSMIRTGFTFSLHFCGENRLEHSFCDVPVMIKISCIDTLVNEIVLFILSALIITTTTVILVSYAHILSTVLKIPSTHGRCKTFSTCSSHITVVSLFYGTVFFMYAQTGPISSPKSKVIAVFYTLVIPMLNL
nr:olfactory receptor 1020-like [Macaca nemestrina]